MRRSTRSNLIRWAWAVVLALIVFGLFYVQVNGQSVLYIAPVLQNNIITPVYIRYGNLFNDLFKEPFEILYVLCRNGDVYGFTNKNAESVSMPLELLYDTIKKNGHDFNDIMFVIHNHFGNPFPSEEDKKFYNRLKLFGFTGQFGVIDTSSGQVTWINDDDN